jgi:hypothetical protein
MKKSNGNQKLIKAVVLMASFCAMVLFSGLTFAQEIGPVEIVATGCEQEINTYCKDVTPGEGRVLACLFAHGDKLTNRCEYALYQAASELEQIVAAVTFLVGECADDLEAYCLDVEPGEGRLLQCIDDNLDKVSERCKQALQDVNR